METTTIGFIGLGLIGGSIAKAIKKFHPDYQIIAYNRTRETLDDAVFEGIVDIACEEMDSKFSLCDYIFLCATVDYNIECLKWLKTKNPSRLYFNRCRQCQRRNSQRNYETLHGRKFYRRTSDGRK